MKYILAFLLLLIPSIASAQAPNITSYVLEVFAPGVPTTGTPVLTLSFPSTSAVCNQTAPSVPPNVVNPTQFWFDDSAVSGKVCIVQILSGSLNPLPNAGGYTSAVSQTDNLGQQSARSAASNPFAKQGIPSTLTNLKVK